jgi:HTH-type transcriptional regulator/antitoxin HipB
MDYPIRLPGELREYLRALRKEQGLTQAALGELVGVSQARIAEIESNPGVVSVEQLLKLLSALQASLVMRHAGQARQAQQRSRSGDSAITPKKGAW